MNAIFFYLNKHTRWIFPLLLLVIFTPLTPKLDIDIENFFYYEHFSHNSFFQFMYRFGPWPGILTAVVAFCTYLLSYVMSSLQKWRKPALLLTLTLAVGSGLIVHAVLKDHWGRPRPKQVIEFGGNQEFRPYYEPNFFHQPEPSKSFPCGHCSTGFYFFALALVGKRLKNQHVKHLGYALAIVLGVTLSITRMAQGGHFLSDTLVAALIMWFTALSCDWFIYKRYA